MITTKSTLSEMVAQYAALTEQRRQLEAEVNRIKAELATHEERLAGEFAQAGIQNVKTASGQTVYLNREIFAKLVGDPKKARTALRRAGLGDFIKEAVSAQTLRGWVREMDEVIPKGLQPYIDVTEIYKIRMRS